MLNPRNNSQPLRCASKQELFALAVSDLMSESDASLLESLGMGGDPDNEPLNEALASMSHDIMDADDPLEALCDLRETLQWDVYRLVDSECLISGFIDNHSFDQGDFEPDYTVAEIDRSTADRIMSEIADRTEREIGITIKDGVLYFCKECRNRYRAFSGEHPEYGDDTTVFISNDGKPCFIRHDNITIREI